MGFLSVSLLLLDLRNFLQISRPVQRQHTNIKILLLCDKDIKSVERRRKSFLQDKWKKKSSLEDCTDSKISRCQTIIKVSKLKFNGPIHETLTRSVHMCVGATMAMAAEHNNPIWLFICTKAEGSDKMFYMAQQLIATSAPCIFMTFISLTLFLALPFVLRRWAKKKSLFEQLLFFCSSFYHYIKR